MNNKLGAAFPTLVLPEAVELSGHRYLGKKQGDCVKCSTGKISLLVSPSCSCGNTWHLSLVGSVAQPAGLVPPLLGAEGQQHKGQPLASATPQGWCQCGVVHA